MSKLVVKVCCSEWRNGSRDKRELSLCRELGFDTLVFAKGNPEDYGRRDSTDGFDVVRYSTRPMGTLFPNGINRMISLFVWAHHLRKYKADVLTCHDLTALLIGWMSRFFSTQKTCLVYDSHEFEIGRNTKRNKLQKWWITHLERFLIKKCTFSIMVNDAIADEVQKIHKLKERPVVVRSTPNYWTIDPQVCTDTRKQLLDLLEAPREMLLMYHGGVMSDRGIEKLIEVVSKVPYTNAVILGNAETETYLSSLKELVQKYNVSDRIAFHKAVPIEELWKYVGATDVGMVTVPATSKSYYYMLPNKFFENIQSETPVICSDFPAVSGIVREYGIGLLCNPSSTEEIVGCVEKMHNDKEYYNQCKENLKKAKQDLCWKKEKESLKSAYLNLL